MYESPPLISVIIPVYNVGNYLSPCLDSLLAQTYPNMEVLLVDDGSTDGSASICDRYAASDCRFTVFHQEKNHGRAGLVRNIGMENAAGEYIAFVDADDRVAPDYLEKLYQTLAAQGADLVCCRIIRCGKDGEPIGKTGRAYAHPSLFVKESRLVSDRADLLRSILKREELFFTHVVAALFRRAAIRTCRFPDLRCGEDTLFMFDFFCQAPAVYLSDYAGYFNILRPNSITRGVPSYYQPFLRDRVELAFYQYTHLPDPVLLSGFLSQYALEIHGLTYGTAQQKNRAESQSCREWIREHLDRVLSMRDQLPAGLRRKLLLYDKAPFLYNLAARLNERLKGGKQS